MTAAETRGGTNAAFAATPDRPRATMTTIHLPGRPDMTPEQYAAWWAGVPVERLQAGGPDKTLLPPTLSPPDGVRIRVWKVKPCSAAAGRAVVPEPDEVRVTLPTGILRGYWRADPSALQGPRPLQEEDADRIAVEFLGARCFPPSALADRSRRVFAQDRNGRVTDVNVEFEGIFGDMGEATVTVNLNCAAVLSASLSLPRQVPPEQRPPEMTPNQARGILEAELTSRGLTEPRIRGGHLVAGAAWQGPDDVFYVFMVSPGPSSMSGAWYVDATTGKAAPHGEVPAIKKWDDAHSAWLREQSKAGEPAPPPTPTTP